MNWLPAPTQARVRWSGAAARWLRGTQGSAPPRCPMRLVDGGPDHASWQSVGGREDPWSGPPDSAYLPPRTGFSLRHPRARRRRLRSRCAGRPPNTAPRHVCLPALEVEPETRGHSALERTIHPDPDGRPRRRVTVGVRGPNPATSLVQLPTAQARPVDPAHGVEAERDVLPSSLAHVRVWLAARLQRRSPA